MKWLIWIVAGLVVLVVAAFGALQVFFAMNTHPVEPFRPTAEEQQQLDFYRQPESWFIDNLQGPREVVDGQTLDPKLQYIYEQEREQGGDFAVIAPIFFSTPWGRAYIRNGVDRAWTLFAAESADMARVDEVNVPGRAGPIQVRIYRPETESTEPLPVLVYSHGGGWIFASLTSTDRVARLLANEANVLVISIGYRLAPEHPYPAASDDGEDVYLWAREHAAEYGGDPARVGVGGDSAGGHVSINVAQRQAQSNGVMPTAMLLFYPGAGMPQNDPSYNLFGEGYGLNRSFIEFILPRVFVGASPDRMGEADAFMDPANATDLSALPPTIVATAGFDILRDVGRRFAERLDQQGVAVRYTNYPSLAHSFLQVTGVIEDAEIATVESARTFGALVRAPQSASEILTPREPADSLAE